MDLIEKNKRVIADKEVLRRFRLTLSNNLNVGKILYGKKPGIGIFNHLFIEFHVFSFFRSGVVYSTFRVGDQFQ